MHGAYIEEYKDLYHGTTKVSADNIVVTQTFVPSKDGWCGPGVYFYDNRAKAWWSATRTCDYEKRRGNIGTTPGIVIADINKLERSSILDLRTPSDMRNFAVFVERFLDEGDIKIEEKVDEKELFIKKRAMLLSFYCQEKNISLIVGYFKQQPQQDIDIYRKIADYWQLAIGIETIYCVKNPSIIYNIRGR